jgi:FAD binding domain
MMLAVGNQRSYSDVCRLTGGEIMRAGSKILNYDPVQGYIRCEAGATLNQVAKTVIRDGWFFPVVPGTQWATIGGCIANDVHGKNHYTDGAFGHHIFYLGLQRSNGEHLELSHGKMFTATIGGLGLTGIITWAEIRLVRQFLIFDPWYFPLDCIPWYWPLYKRLGLLQYHCVIPERAVDYLFKEMKQSPLLMVKKRFGDIPSVGMLSFCRTGISISMDFANRGARTAQMFNCFDEIVRDSGGAAYPAKYSMSREMFRHSFPRWQEFSKYVDPEFSSDFWERVK